MYPKLGAIPTPSARQGELSGADLNGDYADEGQQQHIGICKKWKSQSSMSVVAISIVLIIGGTAGAGFLYYHFKQDTEENAQIEVTLDESVPDPMRWTFHDLDEWKPIFSVDLRRCGVDEVIPIYLQWTRIPLLNAESGVLFQKVMCPQYNPSDFYLYQRLESPNLRKMFPEYARLENVFAEHEIHGEHKLVKIKYDNLKRRIEPSGWEISLGGGVQHKLESINFTVTFKEVVRQDGKPAGDLFAGSCAMLASPRRNGRVMQPMNLEDLNLVLGNPRSVVDDQVPHPCKDKDSPLLSERSLFGQLERLDG